jgi:nucleotide-binding universal stress UspA family protein
MTGNQILVGVDGSAPSLAAIDFAIGEAKLRDLPLHLIHVAGEPGDLEPAQILRAALDRAGGRDTGEIVTGDASTVLIGRSAGARLVIVGHRGAGGFAELLLGSVSGRLAAYAACPVIVVRGTPGDGDIVVGVDGSEAGAAAVGFACDEADRRGALLVALHAPAGPQFSGPSDALIYDHRYEEARVSKLLFEAVEGWHHQHPDIRIRRTVRWVPAARALVDASQGAQLLVVGARGVGGFPGARLGGVCHTLLHHAGCPVAVVHP